ncbi:MULTISPECIES: hypothetical protein [unclassified Mesorhizobium]|uniref:hypothetical protein n=1 Tax=unclassified Mesorhizobium TaxID=325217 RepID=UPI001FDA5A9E|nr:hypothetical protein [Mesorhizobium sp. L2C084A000]
MNGGPGLTLTVLPLPSWRLQVTKNRSLGFWATTYVCTALLGVALALTYVGLEQPVYYWDFAAYFDTFSQQGTLLVQSPLEWLSHLRTSIATDDYSAAILVPLMPFHIIFGDSRFSYIAGTVAVYLVPTALLIGRISYLEAATGTSSCRSWLTVWIAAFLYTPFWAATLRGLPDIAGCFALCAATYFLWKSRFLTHEPVISGIRVGVCLWLAFVLRRWYAYPVIGVGISAAFFCFLQAKDRDFPALRNAAVGSLCAILVVSEPR